MCNQEFDMICKIHRFEDKLLRSKNYHEQEELQSILRCWRMQLQKLQFDNQKKKLLGPINRLFCFFICRTKYMLYYRKSYYRRKVMKTNYMAMVRTANEKYRKLVKYIYQLKNGSEEEYDKIFNLISSVHEDEISLIVSLYEAEQIVLKPEVSVPDFMVK